MRFATNLSTKWEKAKRLRSVCETQGKWWEGVPSRRLRKLPVLAGQIKGKLLIFISEKNAGVGTKKIIIVVVVAIYRRHSIEWDCMQIRTDTYIYIYIPIYIERANTLYIQTLEPPSNCNVYAIYLCAFDAKHKLTLQTFCGLKSAASGTLSMGQSETGKERCRGVSEVWQV